MALEHDQILPLSQVDNQVCEQFAVHPNLGTLQELFNDGDLMFFANTGVLTKPTDDENYGRDTETQLFAHNVRRCICFHRIITCQISPDMSTVDATRCSKA